MLRSIRNVVFDLAGVLVNLHIDRPQAAFRALGMPRTAELLDPCYPADPVARFERGDFGFEVFCDTLRKLDQVPTVSNAAISEAYCRFFAGVQPWKIELLNNLRSRGIGVYVLSNNNPEAMKVIRQQFAAIEGRRMEEYFDHIFLSYEMHALKPDVAIFHQLINASQIVPEETLLIDDGKRTIDQAFALGFQVYCPETNADFSHLFRADLDTCNGQSIR